MEELTNAESQRGGFDEYAKVEGPVSMIELEEVDSFEAHEEWVGEWTN